MRRSAFTLVEVMAVVALLALAAGVTVWSLAQDAQHGSRVNVIGAIAHADRMARLAAQRLGEPCLLQFDLDHQRLWRIVGDEEGARSTTHALNLPRGYRIDQVVVARSSVSLGRGSPASEGEKLDSGMVGIPYSTGGRSASYAVRLVWEGGGNANDSQPDSEDGEEWLLFSGLTGQMMVDLEEDEIHNLFARLATGRSDAD